MKKITKDELEVFLRKHKLWLAGDEEGERANLTGANLRGANLRGANLTEANLTEANLTGANLTGANLTGANLTGANLRGAKLREANLRGANLTGAKLREANLTGANNIIYPIACPEKGEFIGFKKAKGLIVELLITKDARRCSATTRKCRCDRAKVLSITNIDGTIADVLEVSSDFNSRFVYKVGETVEEPKFNENRWAECSEGIHFFITRGEAVNY